MARRCPHCGIVIDYVKFTQSVSGWQDGTIDDHGSWETDHEEMTDSDNFEMSCPECDRAIRGGSGWIEEADDDDDDDIITVLESDKATNNDEWTNLV